MNKLETQRFVTFVFYDIMSELDISLAMCSRKTRNNIIRKNYKKLYTRAHRENFEIFGSNMFTGKSSKIALDILRIHNQELVHKLLDNPH